jgi:AraC family transcriptional regulator
VTTFYMDPELTPAYGDRIAELFHLPEPRGIKVKTITGQPVSITRLSSPIPLIELTDPIPQEKSFLVAVQLESLSKHELWIDGAHIPVKPYEPGSLSIVDLESNPIARLASPFDCVQFHIPRSSISSFSEEHELRRTGTLYAPQGVSDPFVLRLAELMLPYLDNPADSDRLLVDSFTTTLLAHLVMNRSSDHLVPDLPAGSLSPWQQKRVKEILRQHLDGDLSLAVLASECRLSTSHFARAFKTTFKKTVHNWVLDERLESAQFQLKNSALSLSEIALNTGFSDQPSFTRAFRRKIGATPGEWRRIVGRGPKSR